MLFVAERIGRDLGETSDDGQGRELRLGREPALDDSQMRVELRGHAHARLVCSLLATMRGANLSGRRARAKPLRERQRICW